MRILLFVLLTIVSSGLAAAQNCPETCSANFTATTITGTKPAGVVFLVTPLGNTNGTGVWVIPQPGDPPKCSTCTSCRTNFVFSWNAPNHCVAYNTCGKLAQGPMGGSMPGSLRAICDGSQKIKFEIGTCNPLYNGSNCATQPPVTQPPAYSEDWTLTCGNCQ